MNIFLSLYYLHINKYLMKIMKILKYYWNFQEYLRDRFRFWKWTEAFLVKWNEEKFAGKARVSLQVKFIVIMGSDQEIFHANKTIVEVVNRPRQYGQEHSRIFRKLIIIYKVSFYLFCIFFIYFACSSGVKYFHTICRIAIWKFQYYATFHVY